VHPWRETKKLGTVGLGARLLTQEAAEKLVPEVEKGDHQG
jgi:hypothetical protein